MDTVRPVVELSPASAIPVAVRSAPRGVSSEKGGLNQGGVGDRPRRVRSAEIFAQMDLRAAHAGGPLAVGDDLEPKLQQTPRADLGSTARPSRAGEHGVVRVSAVDRGAPSSRRGRSGGSVGSSTTASVWTKQSRWRNPARSYRHPSPGGDGHIPRADCAAIGALSVFMIAWAKSSPPVAERLCKPPGLRW